MDYDIAIIGAGISGAGVAQAAAAAGYKVLLLEQTAIACATSRSSSKLIHGGLRYLESAQFSLVRESLTERALLLKLAPELVKLANLHIPVYRNSQRAPLTIAAGLSLYRLLSGFDSSTRFSRLKPDQWPELDSINTEHLKAVFRYQEAQTDDRALTAAVVQSAQQLGAELALPATFCGAETTPEFCDLRYRHNGREQQARAAMLVNCAGPWAPQVNQLISPTPALPEIELIQGAHLLLPPQLKHHYYLESPSDGRAVFALPWQGKLLLGTTETPHTGEPANAHCHPHEMHYLLNVLKHYFPDLHILPSSAESFAGLRVLPRSSEQAFGRSRESIMELGSHNRVFTLMGGKLTTYRATAEQTLEQLAPQLPQRTRRADTRTLALTPVS
ncbi:glycerol-3-phosphate dehydrogenase/oxidase [Gilvimarinus agarilyticus]|uniref:glycerol-3-phosphate dehydrogenase/oxidase n=1 Tax=Gilvimarinus agarilyticus TaxID=679259 RepID=UPI0005A1460A|nr:FAD-dependent oxidoreductase [Gilvimarinus agarilyticus]